MARFLSPYRSGRVWPTPLASFNREMSRMFEDLLHPGAETAAGFDPDIDVTETDNELRITAELPGMEEPDLEVSVGEGMLTIRGEKKEEHEREDKGYVLRERSFGRIERVVPLPAGLDPDSAKATFKNGVLTVTIPKTPEAQAAVKRIQVHAA